jgi:hypothetical protein
MAHSVFLPMLQLARTLRARPRLAEYPQRPPLHLPFVRQLKYLRPISSYQPSIHPYADLASRWWECSAGEAHVIFRAGAIEICDFANWPVALWQSITLQQFIEITGPSRQGIVIFFTIFLSLIYSSAASLSTALFRFLRHRGLDSAMAGHMGKDQK